MSNVLQHITVRIHHFIHIGIIRRKSNCIVSASLRHAHTQYLLFNTLGLLYEIKLQPERFQCQCLKTCAGFVTIVMKHIQYIMC